MELAYNDELFICIRPILRRYLSNPFQSLASEKMSKDDTRHLRRYSFSYGRCFSDVLVGLRLAFVQETGIILAY